MSLQSIIHKTLGAVLNSPFLQTFGARDVYKVLKDRFELSTYEMTQAYQNSYAYALSAIAAGLASDESWRSFIQKVAQSRVESEFSAQVFSVYLQPFAESEALQAEALQQFRQECIVNCRALAEQKDHLFEFEEFGLSEAELAALLQDCEIEVLSQLLLEHLQSVAQTAEVLNPSLVKFLAYKNLLGHAVLFFLREQLRDNPRFERTLAALRQEGMLFEVRDFKQAQVELKSSLENKLSAIEQQLAAQNQRLIDAASPDELSQIWQQKQDLIKQQAVVNQAMTNVPQHSVYAQFNQFCDQFANWSLLLDSQVEVVIAALSDLQYVVEKIDRNVEMILAELRELAARIDVSAKIKARDEFSVYNSVTENRIRQAIRQFKNLANYLDYPQAAMQVGSIASGLGDLKEAKSLLIEIFKTSKNNNEKALAAYNLFFIYLRQGSNDNALKCLNAAIRLNRQAHILHNIDRYPIKSLLGAGGMGCVFLCEDTLEQRLVTVKCLWEIQSSGEADEIFAEPLAMAKIAENYVPKPLDYGYVDAVQRERAFFVTEFVEGAIDGEAWLVKYGQMDLATGAAVGIQVAQALQKAHEKDIFHLDLKPANLLLKSSESGIAVKILDFGLAKIATSLRQVADSRQRQSARSQLAQQVFGTFDYAPPEQWGDREYRLVSAKSDVFALGKTLYRFFSGKRPQHNIRQKYLPKAEGLLDLLEDCVEDDPKDRPDIATLLERLVGLLPKPTPRKKPKPTRIEKQKSIAPDQLSLQIGHSSDVNSVAFSPDGKTALSGSRDHSVKWWDLSSGRVIKSLEAHSSYVSSVAFSPDGK
ncbi:MAG: serine/threonine-protein kinase, partial [Pseudomonadota bacterium]